MMVQHRLIGNIPGRGHGAPLLSPGFPLDFPLAAATNYRAPITGQAPNGAATTSVDGKYHVFLKTYEIQATHFGRYALISTRVFRPDQTVMRPMTYMNTVVVTDEGGAPERFLSPKELMTFNGFVQPAQFAALRPTDQTLPSAPWTQAPEPERRRLLAPRTAAHRALLARFWGAASARFWGDAFNAVTVCLGDSPKPDDIIEGAKSLLLCDLLDDLPPAVQHIASMSACGTMAADVFPGSAMVVVYPPEPGNTRLDFDLRSPDAYPALSPQEDRFIRSFLENGWCKMMRDVLQRYRAVVGCADEARAPIASDYTLVSLIDLLQRSIHREPDSPPLSQCLAIWRDLQGRLTQRHHLSAAQANAVLAGVEAAMLPVLLASPQAIAAIDETLLAALWEKLLTVDDALAPSFAALIAASAHVRRFPTLIESHTDGSQAQAERAALLLRHIIACGRAEHALTPESIAALTTPSFEAALSALPPVHDALCDLLRRANADRPDRLLLTLPLSCRLLDGRQALSDAIALLRHAYVGHLPGEAEQANLRSACMRHIDSALLAELNGYFADCLPVHLCDLLPLLCMVQSLAPDTGDTLRAMLGSAQRHGILLSAELLLQLLHALLPHCAHPELIGQDYANYESALSAQMHEEPLERLTRLVACSQGLSAIGFDATQAVVQILHALGAQLLAPDRAEQLATRLLPLCNDQARVAEAFHAYLLSITRDDPLYYFTNAHALDSLTPFIRALRTDMTDTVCGILSSIASGMPCAPAEQLHMFFDSLLPQCQDRARVMAEFDRYIDASIAHCAANAADGFPWLYQIQPLCAHLSASSGVAPLAIEEKTARYLIQSRSTDAPPYSDKAVYWWGDLATKRRPIFEMFSADLLAVYDRMLVGPAQELAAHQLAILLPLMHSTAGLRAVTELAQRWTTEALCRKLQEGVRLRQALSDVAMDARRCGLSDEELLRQTENEARGALQREFSAYTTPQAFGRAKLDSSGPYASLHNEELAKAFKAFADKQVNRSLSLEYMDALNESAQRLGLRLSSLPTVIRQLKETITQPGAGPNQFRDCLAKIRDQRSNIPNVTQELRKLVGESCAMLPFPQNVYAAMLCYVSDDGARVNWRGVLATLGASRLDGTSAPYSPQGLALLSLIHAICNALDALPQPESELLGQSFLTCLRQGELCAFRDHLLAKSRARARYLPPELITSPLMKSWLSA